MKVILVIIIQKIVILLNILTKFNYLIINILFITKLKILKFQLFNY